MCQALLHTDADRFTMMVDHESILTCLAHSLLADLLSDQIGQQFHVILVGEASARIDV